MKSPHHILTRAGALALGAVAISAVVLPVAASSEQPAVECPQPRQGIVAVVDVRDVALIHGRQVARMEAVRAGSAAIMEGIRVRQQAAEIESVRPRLDVARVESIRPRLDAAGIEAIRLWDVAGIDSALAVARFDRDVDDVEWRRRQHEGHALAEKDGSTTLHPLGVGIDVIVGLARVPARAALAMRHLVEAFAKVTPRIARALL